MEWTKTENASIAYTLEVREMPGGIDTVGWDWVYLGTFGTLHAAKQQADKHCSTEPRRFRILSTPNQVWHARKG